MADNPFVKAERIELVRPNATARGMAFVILDRVDSGQPLEYCVHGRTQCYACGCWLWLGDKTLQVLRSGQAAGLCVECAVVVIPPHREPAGHVDDHRRADGPH